MLVVAAAGGAAFALLGGGDDDEASTHTLRGIFELTDSSGWTSESGTGSRCYGDSGYDDIDQGVDVVVRDGKDQILASGSLGKGTATEGGCYFQFKVVDVPFSKFYAIEVGRRGKLTYTPAELEKMKWAVVFTLG